MASGSREVNKLKKKSTVAKYVVHAIPWAREKSSNDKIIKRKNQYPFPPLSAPVGEGRRGSKGLETLINV